jgi:hypothetical protein
MAQALAVALGFVQPLPDDHRMLPEEDRGLRRVALREALQKRAVSLGDLRQRPSSDLLAS